MSGKPEIHRVESDVFDPAGGDRMTIHGRNFSGYTDVRVGVTQATVTSEPMAGTPTFDGVNDQLGNASLMSAFILASSWWWWGLVYVKAINNTAIIQLYTAGDPIWNDDLGYVGVFLGGAASDQVYAYHWDSAAKYATSTIPKGRWCLVQAWYDGANVNVSVDEVVGTPGAAGSLGSVGGKLLVGTQYQVFRFGAVTIAEQALRVASPSAGERANIAGYVNKRYGLSLGGVLPSTYDPADLSLTGWWRSGGYVSGTWTGTASAGSSGSRNLTEATNPPAVANSTILLCTAPAKSAGDTISAFPDFDGTNDCLATAVTSGTIFGSGGWSFSALIAVDVADNTGRRVFTTSLEYTYLTIFDTGVSLTQYNTAGTVAQTVTVTMAIPTGSYLIQARWTGTNIQLRVNGGAWATTAQTQIGGTADTLLFGCKYNKIAGYFLDGRVQDQLFVDSSLADAQFDQLAGYANARYGLTLGTALPNAFDPATLSLTLWHRSGGYVSGTWTGTASAGSSGSRNLTEATNPPAVARSFTARRLYPIAVKNASGRGVLADAVQYANPGTLPDCVWWLRADDADIDVNGSTEVTTWRDRSGVSDTNRNAAPPGTDKPSWNSADANYGGKPTVGTFNKYALADDCRLVNPGAWSATYTSYAIGVIGEGAATSNRYFTCESGTDYNALVNASGAPTAYGYNSTPIIQSVGTLSNPRSFLMATYGNGGLNGVLYAESVAPVTGDLKGAGGGDTLGDAAMTIGSYVSAGATTWGVERIAEVYAHSRAPTLREVRTLRRYRDSYYGQIA